LEVANEQGVVVTILPDNADGSVTVHHPRWRLRQGKRPRDRWPAGAGVRRRGSSGTADVTAGLCWGL